MTAGDSADGGLQVILIGFMGAGKTTAGTLLARHIRARFEDLDTLVKHEAGMTVAEIFRYQGEARFRQLEAVCLREWLEAADGGSRVLALGGGSVESAEVRALLAGARHAKVFYLAAPLPTLRERCEQQGVERPLLGDAEARFGRRRALYETLGVQISTAGRSPKETAAELQALLEGAQ